MCHANACRYAANLLRLGRLFKIVVVWAMAVEVATESCSSHTTETEAAVAASGAQ